jgi:hypothetical protein
MARLVLDCDGVDVTTHELVGHVITIGRAPSNDVVIDDPTVSAQHAWLTKAPSGYYLKDLGSTNGTQISGVSITDAELKDRAEIRFGCVTAVFRDTDPTLPMPSPEMRCVVAVKHADFDCDVQNVPKAGAKLPPNMTPFAPFDGLPPLNEVDQTTMRRLRELADRKGWSIEEVIREAVMRWVAQREPEQKLEAKIVRFPKR